MYIEPNTNIRILQNVPLDKTYKHTIYFGSRNAQMNYFSGKTKFNLTRQSYQRKERGYMRVQVNAEKLYNCNYIMYQNTSFDDSKWFYAFITSVEYVNNEVSEVGFELDVMQTWFFDVTLKESFVEREHSVTDVAGDNIIDEPLKIGDYFMGTPVSSGFFNIYDPVVVSPYTYFKNEVQPWKTQSLLRELDGSPIAINFEAFDSTRDKTHEASSPSFFGKALAMFPEDSKILTIYLLPHSFIEYTIGSDDEPCDILEGTLNSKIYTINNSKPTTLADGYIPINKKLLTYPYNKLVIDTGDGNLTEYMYEYFEPYYDAQGTLKNGVEFVIDGYRGLNCCFKATPRHYKNEAYNYSECCLLTDFPCVSFLTDSFKQWFAQNKTRLALQTGATIASIIGANGSVMAGSQMLTPKTQVISKNGAKMMASGYDKELAGIKGIAGTIAEGFDRANTRYSVHPGSSDGSLEIRMGKKDFTAIQYSVNTQNAKVIDDFFTMFGYAVKTIKVPNRNVRPHWTYTKTLDCNLIGNAPADDVAKICSIYDNGITFWNNGNEIGNYSLDNSPI